MSYANTLDLNLDHDDAVAAVTDALAKEGFGILTRADVQATLQAKLGADFKPYTILGACNPPLAYQALQAEDPIGVLLPCNVVVSQQAPNRCRVYFTDVRALFTLVERDDISPIADAVAERLERARASLIE